MLIEEVDEDEPAGSVEEPEEQPKRPVLLHVTPDERAVLAEGGHVVPLLELEGFLLVFLFEHIQEFLDGRVLVDRRDVGLFRSADQRGLKL